MIPIPKAVIDLAVTVLRRHHQRSPGQTLAIQRCASDRIASNGKEERNDRPS